MKKSILAILCALALIGSLLPLSLAEEEVLEEDGWRYVLVNDEAVVIEYVSQTEGGGAADDTVKSVVINYRLGRKAFADFRRNPFYVADGDYTQRCAPGVLPGHRTITAEGGILFVVPSHKLVSYPVFLEPEEYAVPAGIEIIGAYAFACNPLLVTAVLPDGLTAIQEGAFHNCAALSAVNIPASVTEIAADAFDGCPDSLVLTVIPGTYGETFAKENEIPYKLAR